MLQQATRCAQVACGAHHCLVATRSGAVYSWGLDTDSQLGHGRLVEGASFLSHPRPIDALAGQHISQVTQYITVHHLRCLQLRPCTGCASYRGQDGWQGPGP